MSHSNVNLALFLMLLTVAPAQVWSAALGQDTSSVLVVVDGMMKAKSGAT